jgi:hypothetical protein
MTSAISSSAGGGVAAAQVSPASASSGLSSEERLLALVVYTQTSQLNAAQTSVNLNFDQLEKLREQVKKAIDEARDAKKDAGFWGGLAKIFGGDVASIASAVAACAAVIATGGAAAAVLAVIAAAATIAADHAKELGIPPEVAMAIAVSAGVASLCCGNGQGMLRFSDAVTNAASKVRVWANVGAAASKAAGGGLGVVEGKFEEDAGMHQADARSAEGRQDLVSADIDEALDRFAAAVDHQDSAIKTTSSIQQQSAASQFAILNNWVGAA